MNNENFVHYCFSCVIWTDVSSSAQWNRKWYRSSSWSRYFFGRFVGLSRPYWCGSLQLFQWCVRNWVFISLVQYIRLPARATQPKKSSKCTNTIVSENPDRNYSQIEMQIICCWYLYSVKGVILQNTRSLNSEDPCRDFGLHETAWRYKTLMKHGIGLNVGLF